MTWTSALVGMGVGAILLLPLALKWQLPLSIVGAWTIVVGAVSGALWAAVLGGEQASWLWLVLVVASILLLSAAGAAFAFFRDPERSSPDLPGAIVSPADGTVLYIRRFSAGEAPPMDKHQRPILLQEFAQVGVGGDGLVIGVGMHLLNVHVNRAPVAGCAATLLRTPGRFVSLRREEATTVNERFTTVIEGDQVRVVVVQIASRLVRRIVSYLKEGEEVVIGQRIGMIRFGSQVDVILPDLDALELCLKPGDVVRAGVSVLALMK